MNPVEVFGLLASVPVALSGVLHHIGLRFIGALSSSTEPEISYKDNILKNHHITKQHDFMIGFKYEDVTTSYDLDAGLRSTTSHKIHALGLWADGKEQHNERPILDTDLPIIAAWAKLAGVKQPLNVTYIPTQKKTVQPE